MRSPSPDFRARCYEIIRHIPEGRVMTYGDVAFALGRPGAARAVGTAMRLNDDAPRTPCHRVVASTGLVGEYSGKNGRLGKIAILAREGVPVDKAGRIRRFEEVRWRPNQN